MYERLIERLIKRDVGREHESAEGEGGT